MTLNAVGQGVYGGQSPLCRRPGVYGGQSPLCRRPGVYGGQSPLCCNRYLDLSLIS